MTFIKKHYKSFIYLFLLMTLLNTASYADGKQYLRLPVFARAESMGGAYTAIAEDAGAFFYNPAGVARYQGENFLVSSAYADWVEGAKKISTVVILPDDFGDHIFLRGASLDYFTVSGLKAYDEYGNRDGDISYYDLAVGLNFGKKFDSLAVGTNLKLLLEKLDDYSGSGFSADLGALYKATEEIQLGASLNNLGTFSLEEIDVDMPTTYRIGAAYKIPEFFTLGLDLENNSKGSNIHLGSEVYVIEELSVQAGWKSTQGGGVYSLGTSLSTEHPELSNWGGQILVNYSFSGGGNLDTINHRIDAGVRFRIH